MSEEPKRGDTVWIRGSDYGDWTDRQFYCDLGPEIQNRYMCFWTGARKEVYGWRQMSTTDPNAPEYKTGDRVILKDGVRKDKQNGPSGGFTDKVPEDRVITLNGTHNKGFYWRAYNDSWVIRLDEIKCLAPEPERVWWTAQDYAERQITTLKNKETGMYDVISRFDDNHLSFYQGPVHSRWMPYENISKTHTLPDETGLYKHER